MAPRIPDTITRIDGRRIEQYPDYVRAIYDLHRRVGDRVEVQWIGEGDGARRAGVVTVARRPLSTYLWSLVWFLQEMVIFAIGAGSSGSGPDDDSARLFFWLCVVTVGAYMGGYHWTEIVVEPPVDLSCSRRSRCSCRSSACISTWSSRRPHAAFLAHRRLVLRLLYGVADGLPGGALGEHGLVALVVRDQGGRGRHRWRSGWSRSWRWATSALAAGALRSSACSA